MKKKKRNCNTLNTANKLQPDGSTFYITICIGIIQLLERLTIFANNFAYVGFLESDANDCGFVVDGVILLLTIQMIIILCSDEFKSCCCIC